MKALKLLSILMVLLVSLGLAGCSSDNYKEEKASEGYFKRLTMDMNGQFYVAQRVDTDDAKTSGLVYQVEMDEQDKTRVKQITAYDNGYKVRRDLVDRYIGVFGRFHQIRISYEDDAMKYEFFDVGGEATSGFFGADSVRLQFDENKRVSDIYLYNSGMLMNYVIPQYRIVYDDKDRLSVVIPVGTEKTSKFILAETPSRTEYTYGEGDSNRAISISPLSNEGIVIAKYDLTYDKQGRIVRVETHRGEGAPYRQPKSLPLELESTQGPLLFVRNFEGLPFYSASPIVEYTYDDRGLVSVRFKNSDGSASDIGSYRGVRGDSLPPKTGISEIDVKRDKNGNIVEISTKGVDGKPIALNEKGATAVKLNYSGDGRIESIQWLKDGKPITADFIDAHNDNLGTVTFEWKNEGIFPSSEAFFDLNGQPLDVVGRRGVQGELTYHKYIENKDENGRVTRTYYNINGQEVKTN